MAKYISKVKKIETEFNDLRDLWRRRRPFCVFVLAVFAVLVSLYCYDRFFVLPGMSDKIEAKDRMVEELNKELDQEVSSRINLEATNPRLRDLQEFASIGKRLSVVVFVKRLFYAGSDSVVYATDSVGYDFHVPLICRDSSLREDWFDVAGRIALNRREMSPEILAGVDSILAFVKSQPWPTEESIEAYERSSWSMPETVGRWLTLHTDLERRIRRAVAADSA